MQRVERGRFRLGEAFEIAKRSVKFGGGFYCAEMLKEDGTSIYVFNAFFMSMRSQFVEKGKQIKWFVVELTTRR